MGTLASFSLENFGYLAKQLQPKDAAVLQQLYEQCTDFALLSDGLPPAPTAALEEFEALPDGKTIQDKYIFGLFDSCNRLVGMMESIRHYPDHQTWWIGLMMLAPEVRGNGLGTEFYKSFKQWVATQGVSQISLAVFESNKPGLKFWKKMGFEVIRKAPPQQFGLKTHERHVLSSTLQN